ncbi:MAG: universal stress protein [Rhodothermales bacterium]|nr:universal stress protein [Rhodothermales bacterium]MBO6778827.1 universal stress protein [Rhodothermales bacterium]
MIKKILVALDPDSDTPTATRYAVEIAKRDQASITGLAVVDMGSIASSSRGGGVGSMYYADKLRGRLTAEARDRAHELIREFSSVVSKAGVEHTELLQEGVPFRRIVEDMKYHDLLVVGNDPHFFYSHPKEATETLARVVRKTVGPTLIVSEQYRKVKNVLIAYDGSNAAARAMRTFVRSKPFGSDIAIRLICIWEKKQAEAELMLQLASEFIRAHGLNPEVAALKSDDVEGTISAQISQFDADVVVAGAHSKSRIRSVAFGSTTSFLVKQCPVNLYLD